MTSTRAFALTALTAAALALSGCGKKGPLDIPPGAATTKVTTPAGKEKTVRTKPSRPFVLDGLLN